MGGDEPEHRICPTSQPLFPALSGDAPRRAALQRDGGATPAKRRARAPVRRRPAGGERLRTTVPAPLSLAHGRRDLVKPGGRHSALSGCDLPALLPESRAAADSASSSMENRRRGGRAYVRRMLATLDDVRLRTPVRRVTRERDGVTIAFGNGESQRFDAVVLAGHAPDSLQLLGDANASEHQILGAVRYQPNAAVLHTDPKLLPRRRRVWSAWNYVSQANAAADAHRPVCVSYLINQLQALPFTSPVIVTLNPSHEPAPDKVLGRYAYEHPLLDLAAVDAQSRLPDIQGRQRTWFAGAWTGYGFHEDGLKSALRVADDFGVMPTWAQP
ncbi:FAD-dependent oxidoreductase [Pandoraea sp. XY-2]|uniref:FAD-dependent oxidoreductase n=1 Tax=Pandoraea sp. XY-2 TaxID=2518599 RepID=UPI001F0FD81F|nr:FAD-dependent oxidoreductase [Pandoraea sp. XY-2]